MPAKVQQNVGRFKEIVKGRIKKDLRKYITHGEMIGKQGGEFISIPLPQIDLPHFRFGRNDQGVGQGEGEEGDAVGEGASQAGDAEGQHILEVDITLDELAEILGEELALPNIEPKGSDQITATKDRYTSIRNVGPESLRHVKRTYRQALRRQIMTGTYDPRRPRIVPEPRDRRYRTYTTIDQPETNAAVIYIMDVSGSMGAEQKELVRITTFWLDTWLASQYDGLALRYIIHDAKGRIVDRDTFFHTRESGGTIISSGFEKAIELINTELSPNEYNLYLFHFSDGDNWDADNKRAMELLQTDLLPHLNLYCYGQVHSPYGSGKFLNEVSQHIQADLAERVITSRIKNKEMVYDCLKEFLGTGK
ncbi:MAG: DUF444 family protein [Nitrospirota bacterium]|jgi:uncharacterized sporulation protein YeaH/YhbH (DUF444 family)